MRLAHAGRWDLSLPNEERIGLRLSVIGTVARFWTLVREVATRRNNFISVSAGILIRGLSTPKREGEHDCC